MQDDGGLFTGVPGSLETPDPPESPQIPRHGATVGSWGVVVSSKRGTHVSRVGRGETRAAFVDGKWQVTLILTHSRRAG